ncbi:aquaporin Z [Vulgatibacter sp.]|uniref:aquaporin Z n=1 Tax=Vulgatibacter sp. TaxID=1971226 RepID=UPI0035698AF8
MEPTLLRRTVSEFLGTFTLVFGGVGAAVITPPGTGIGMLGVALAFGLTVLCMAYALGHVSGAHFNPAVTVGLAAAGRFPARKVLPYVVAQVAGAILAALVIYALATGKPGFDLQASGLGANGFGAHSPEGYGLWAALLAETLLTFLFVVVVLGATDTRAPAGFAPLAIGLALTLVHLVGIPFTNTSVNPARSTGPALIVGGWALGQLWLFWLAPLVGGIAAGAAYAALAPERSAVRTPRGAGTPAQQRT